MTARRVLVTGAGGFIGRWTLAPLRASGAEVHAVARAEAPAPAADVVWHQVDLQDRAAVASLMAAVRPSHLLHLAWYVTPGLYLTSLENLRWVGATVDLLEAFGRAGGRRAVVAGTSAEYDPTQGICIEGRTPLAPATLYAACKRGVYEVMKGWSAQTGVTFAWGRVFNLYGPGEAPDRLVPQLIRAGLSHTPFAMRHPAQVRDYMHVADTGRALAALVGSDVEDAVNIGSGEPVVLANLAREIAHCLGEPVALRAAAPEPDRVPTLVADATRLRTEVGFTPQYSLTEGLRDTVEWSRAWWKAHKDPALT